MVVKPFVLYNVYAVDEIGRRLIARSRAVSPEKAANNVRFRFWVETPTTEIGVTLVAEVVTNVPVVKPKPRISISHKHDRRLVWRDMLRSKPVF